VVVATAIAKDRNRRYQTAQDLAEELRRVRMHEPIVAKPVGPLVRLARWAQRNPGLAVALSALFVVLVSGLAIALRLEARATRKADEAEDARKSLADSIADYDRLGDLSRLQRLEADAEKLWPCAPSMVSAMSEWVQQAAALATRLDGHEAQLASLRKAGRAVFPESKPGDSRPTESRPTYLFATDSDQFKHDTTARLVSDLTAFVAPDPHEGLLADVRGRIAFAESVEERTIGKYAPEWAEAIRSIANATECPKYGGLRITPQLGLIPIGRDPSSGLWEFAHLQTTATGTDPIPKRRADGRLAVTDSMGLVLVLLPGGTFNMGATKPPTEDTAPTEPNIDREAERRESPVTPVSLDPFFLSKYEMTQGQWLRLVGKNPSTCGSGSSYGGKMVGLTNPVEQVNWEDCDVWLGRLSLVIPTEAQWEYGARGGTTTPRWTGLGTEGLVKAANLADQFCKQNGGSSTWRYESWDDGYKVHAPVGEFAPNPFGLHDVLGNVFEWCRDEYGAYEMKPRARDGLRSPPNARGRVYRGGSFNSDAPFARSAYRFNFSQEFRYAYLGVRPARSLDP
jgi:formylglycine-generating enzyme required for sulfatase activity